MVLKRRKDMNASVFRLTITLEELWAFYHTLFLLSCCRLGLVVVPLSVRSDAERRALLFLKLAYDISFFRNKHPSTVLIKSTSLSCDCFAQAGCVKVSPTPRDHTLASR